MTPPAGERGHEIIALGADVIERHHQQHRVGRARAHFRGLHLDEAKLTRVIEHGALRPSGRAAGVDQISDVGWPGAGFRRVVARFRKQGFVILGAIERARTDDDKMLEFRKLRADVAGDRGIFLIEDQHAGRGILDDVFDLRGGQPVVDRHRDEARYFAGGIDLDIGVGVLRQDRDTVLPPHAHFIKCVGQAINPRALLAEAEASSVVDQRSVRAEFPGADLDNVAQCLDAEIQQHQTSPLNASAPPARHLEIAKLGQWRATVAID